MGESPLAGEFRRLVTAGAVPGWDLHPVPPGRTPLEALAGPLLRRTGSRRFYNILERHGFAHVEEVAVTPDECLLELRNSGPRLIAAVRAVISELGPEDNTASPPDNSGAGPVRGLAANPPALPPDIAGALQVIAAWGITERGARTVGNLLTLAPAAAGMPSDVARCWDRLAQLSLRPLAGPAEPDGHVARLAAELLGETDERRRLIMTSRMFAPDAQPYGIIGTPRCAGVRRQQHSMALLFAHWPMRRHGWQSCCSGWQPRPPDTERGSLLCTDAPASGTSARRYGRPCTAQRRTQPTEPKRAPPSGDGSMLFVKR